MRGTRARIRVRRWGDPRSLRSLGGSGAPPMPLRTVPHRFPRYVLQGARHGWHAATTRPLSPPLTHPCYTLSGCRPAGGKPPARLRVLSVLARYARSQSPCGLCYARPFACGSLLACCLRAPMRSRSALSWVALRSRSVLICFCPPLRLVGVALFAGAPAPLTGLQPSPA